MSIPGRKVKHSEIIFTDRLVVVVPIELVIPDEDDSEQCYEAETIRLLKDVRDHAENGDVKWLQQYGRVYEAIDAA